MKNKLLLLCGIMSSLCLGQVSTPSTYAIEDGKVTSTSIQLSPVVASVTMMGGDVLENDHERCPEEIGCVVQVKNVGDKAYPYVVYASPYIVRNENYDMDFSDEASTSYTQISRWIKFLDDDGTYKEKLSKKIAPGETQTIKYRIEVPEEVPGGSQYAVIWAEAADTNASSSSSVKTTPRTGMVVTGRSIGNTIQTAEISDYDFTRFSMGGPLTAKATVKNTGNTDFDAQYMYTAKTIFGQQVYGGELKTLPAYPETEYHIEEKWEDKIPLIGILRVNFKVNAADQSVDETHLVLIMPIYIMVLLILLLTVIIVWTIIIIRKRKEHKARTLI